jgi:hypothetical protein
MIQITDRQKNIALHCARVASQAFRSDACDANNAGNKRLEEEFLRYYEAAEELIEALE